MITEQLGAARLAQVEAAVPHCDLLPGPDPPHGLHLEPLPAGEDGGGVGHAAVVHDGEDQEEPRPPGARDLTQRFTVDKELVVAQLELLQVELRAEQQPDLLQHGGVRLGDVARADTEVEQLRQELSRCLERLLLQDHPEGGEAGQDGAQSVLVQAVSPDSPGLLEEPTLQLVVGWALLTGLAAQWEETVRTLVVEGGEELCEALHTHQLSVPAWSHTEGFLLQDSLEGLDISGGHQVSAPSQTPGQAEGSAGV